MGNADEVADLADEFVEAEKIVIGYARGPGPKSVEGLAAARKEFTEALAKLYRRVRR